MLLVIDGGPPLQDDGNRPERRVYPFGIGKGSHASDQQQGCRGRLLDERPHFLPSVRREPRFIP